jgi:hypothetical protein
MTAAQKKPVTNAHGGTNFRFLNAAKPSSGNPNSHNSEGSSACSCSAAAPAANASAARVIYNATRLFSPG